MLHLDCGDISGDNCIPQGNARMGISSGVEHDDLELRLGLLDPFNQFTFEVGLAKLEPPRQASRLAP